MGGHHHGVRGRGEGCGGGGRRPQGADARPSRVRSRAPPGLRGDVLDALGVALRADDTPEPLRRAFAGIRDAFPDADGTRAEVAWSALHDLATLQAGGRLRPAEAQARLDLAHHLLTQEETR